MELLGHLVRGPGGRLVVDSELECQSWTPVALQINPVVLDVGDAPAEQRRVELGELPRVVGIEDNASKPDVRPCLSSHAAHLRRTH
jgi:hypothetical protein